MSPSKKKGVQYITLLLFGTPWPGFSSGKDQAIPVQLFGRGGQLPPKDGPFEAGLALQVRWRGSEGWNWKKSDVGRCGHMMNYISDVIIFFFWAPYWIKMILQGDFVF